MTNDIHSDNTITVERGYGYWDLSLYPWGNHFRRFTDSATLPVVKIVAYHGDFTPSKLIAQYNGMR